jgi:hypothetical protein
VWAAWLRATGPVMAVLLPLVWVSQRQSGQVSWLVAPGWDAAEALVRDFAPAPVGAVFWISVLLAAAGLAARRLAVVALPLLVLPPAILMSVSQYRPLFHERYVLYALAGAPLLVAAGADRVAGLLARLLTQRSPGFPARLLAWRPPRFPAPGVRRRSRGLRLRYGRLVTLAGVLAVAVAFVQCLPLYRQDRSPAHRPENLAAVAAVAARDIRPGDPVLYLPSTWRLTALTYPRAFREARDIALRVSGPRSGTLSGRETTPAELRQRLAGLDRVWVVADSRMLRSARRPGDPTDRVKLAVVEEQFSAGEQYVSGRVTLRLYVRRPAQAAAAPPLAAPSAAAPPVAVPAAPAPSAPAPPAAPRGTVTEPPTPTRQPSPAPS